jgi:preprotein translocase subunit YajC
MKKFVMLLSMFLIFAAMLARAKQAKRTPKKPRAIANN